MIIVIVGPTGVGKTKLSIELAKKYNAEIINADSMQIYKQLNIGTAKVTESEKDDIPHHLFDIANLDQTYTVYDYQRDCRKAIKEISSRGKNVILVGGTGLYIKAALFDYRFEEETTYDDFSCLTNDEIFLKVKKYEPNTTVHVNNRKRLIRMLNKYQNGSKDSKHGNKLLYDNTIFLGLTTSRDILYEKINSRVLTMIDNGLVEEVKQVLPFKNQKALVTGIGYKEVFPYLEGTISYNDMIEQIQKNSRHYAKRQYTFFNHQLPVNWIEVDDSNFENTISKASSIISEQQKGI